VVLASSKTPAELVLLRREMGLTASPAICENGAGVLAGGSDALPDNAAWRALRAALDGIDPALRRRFRGFGDMTLAETAAATGLDKEAAARARTRCFSEPGLWSGSADERAAFEAALAEKGIAVHQGGRFLTLGPPTTKADAMEALAAELGATTTIALGDAPNDVAMLERASQGVVIPNPHHPPLPVLAAEREGRVIRAARPGPAGWSQALNALLSEPGPG
jgi:mannosyl-3-phosphoglycerate phosphatase